ncbi:hypothetical protein [Glycomyces paridis]|uniref:Glycosyltransferase family 4 protein n=1 Tax=Glycomyces paridis TaxID=2126555 RepID=A0A4S8PM82_9ACTN|nr:hypothetical protein [Glycomyces paridis]THV31983.1 hypothetical protein E9998_00555 [Glycomyces paridis]
MKILYATPIAKRYRAIETETRLAAEDGHEVHLVADRRPHWDDHEVDPRVTVFWLRPNELRARENPIVTWLLCRLPRAVLRRLRIGPLTRPADRVLRAWDRRVAHPIERRRRRRTGSMRTAYRLATLTGLIEAHDYDWIVLGEPGAVDLLADDLPALLARRPGLRTTYSYETFLEADGVR